MSAMQSPEETEMLSRVKDAGIVFTKEQASAYLSEPDNLGEVAKGVVVLEGFKRCGACGHAKKFYLFNKNSGSKTNTSGSCKECQRKSASKSYDKTKANRNYRQYYRDNKEKKQVQARQYYDKNKEAIKQRHKEYLSTSKGKRVMKRAHTKRRIALAKNKGIPYTREMVIDRDSVFIGSKNPICYICMDGITDISGAGLHIDHIVPVVEGGMDCFSNVACTHKGCNLQREKDARELTVEQVDLILDRTADYMDANPDKFED